MKLTKFKKSSSVSYFLKEGYRKRESYTHYDDTNCTDEWQDLVYQKAREIFDQSRSSSVLDIGTGSGYKLNKYFKEDDTTGLELEQNLEFLREKYPEKKWQLSDFNQRGKYNNDVIICSDIIEHLIDPDDLLEFIHSLDFNYLIISTPDRDIARGKKHQGPPGNRAHTMEWNKPEFYKYISKNFLVVEHYLCSSRQKNENQECQVIVCKKKENK